MVAVHHGIAFSLKDACSAALKFGPKMVSLRLDSLCFYKSNPWSPWGVSEWTIQLWEFFPCILVESLKNPDGSCTTEETTCGEPRCQRPHSHYWEIIITAAETNRRECAFTGLCSDTSSSSRGGELLLFLSCLAAGQRRGGCSPVGLMGFDGPFPAGRFGGGTVTSSAGVEGAEAEVFVIDICIN